MENLYSSAEWLDLAARAKARDGHRCSVARLLGGVCSSQLHAHHLVPVSEGGPELPDLDGLITVCGRHHPTLEALRRYVLRRYVVEVPPCRHHHRYDHARRECRARRQREAEGALIAA